MPDLSVTAAFFASALVLAIAPGPDNIFVLTQSALFGSRAGLATTLGLATGLCAHTCAVAAGIAALLQTSPLAFNLLKCAGAAYLCYLAWQCLKAGASRATAKKMPFPGYASLYKRGIIMNITNPKVALFFLSFLPQFCAPGTGPYALQIVYFGLWFMLATLLVFGLIALLGDKLENWLNASPGKQIFLHRAAAMIFFGLAFMLIFAEMK